MSVVKFRSSTDRASAKAAADPDLFTEYGPTLIRYLSRRVGNDADAHDLAQEAFLRLTRVKDSDLIQKPAAYLFRIAANLASEFHLREKHRHRTIDLDTLAEFGGDGDGDRFQRDMEARSGVKALERLLEELPPLYRAVLLLRKRDGYSYEEIAEKLEVSPHTVHKYLTRAVARCRAEWAE